ncbi:hypothetical protein FQN54_005460 [Arachnomyces sp. PD_36]|nr:hypothetical protein FQN54_005460 [Arachnomyces sp. PD_36]
MDVNIWPESLQKDGLRKYYDRARDMLQPETYPEDFPRLPKLELLKKQAGVLGEKHLFYRAPQTTRFKKGPNRVGVEMNASTLSGMDSTGINDGSKSSTLVNYLADAWNWGTEMFCGCEVRYIKKHPTKEGYLVFFAWHGSGRAKFKDNFHSDLMWVHAKKFVFLGAGSLGTTEILLRSKALGLNMSDKVGKDMSGNGDILAFGYNTNFNVNAIGKENPDPANPVGPAITGVIDCRDQPNPLDGFILQEGSVPEAMAPVLQGILAATPGKVYPGNTGILDRIQKFLAATKSFLLGPYTPHGSMECTQVYLVMSHDSNQATLSLLDDMPVLRFLGVGRSEHVKRLRGLLAKITEAVGGTLVDNIFFGAFGKQEITVHPIGGANISRDGSSDLGVTTEFGEVLSGNGKEIHDGLVVVDGAVVPYALGANPLATITALAERSVEGVAQKHGIIIDYETENGTLDLFGAPAKRLPAADEEYSRALALIKNAQDSSKEGTTFSEIMNGYMYVGSDIEDFDAAANVAKGSCSMARLFISVRSWDTDSLISLPDHQAMVTGTFNCGSLPGGPFLILRGSFKLFQVDSGTSDAKDIVYDFDMISTKGDYLHFHGRKHINPSVTLSPWKLWNATSTLYVTLTKGADKAVVSRGILHLEAGNFVSELGTLTGTGSGDWLSRTSTILKFLIYFLTQLALLFLSPFRSLQWPSPPPKRFKYEKQPPSQTIELIAMDGVPTILNVWDPVVPNDYDDTDVPLGTPVLMVCGASVTDDIFALPTIETNAVEFFTSSGFRVYTLTPRFGITPVAKEGYTAFDARLDVHAALAKVRSLQRDPDKPIYVVAHCVGALAFSMGLLDGTIPKSWIAGITASQVFIDPISGNVNQLKARLPLIEMYDKLLGSWYECRSSPDGGLLQWILDQVLRFYPVGSMKEICSSVVCHRGSLIFGRLWCHTNLNRETHANLSTFLGGISTRTLSHLVEMSRRNYVMSNAGVSLVTESNLERLRGIPILFFSGGENVVFSPLSTEASYSKLTGRFVDGEYERVEFGGRGHLDCWMGWNAVGDIYPAVRGHARRYAK